MIFDLVVLGVIIISCGLAFFRGFIREVLTIIGLAAGAAAAIAFAPKITPWFAHLLHAHKGPGDHVYFGLLPASTLAAVLGYIVIFLLISVLFGIVSHLLSGAARKVGLGPLNRSFGVLFGILRALILIGLFYLPIYKNTTAAQRDKWSWLQGSHTRGYVEALDGWMEGLIPASLLDKAQSRLKEATDGGSNAARNKLDELQLLGHDNAPRFPTNDDAARPPPFPPAAAPGAAAQPPSDDAPAEDETGYAPGQRRGMTDLMKNVDGSK